MREHTGVTTAVYPGGMVQHVNDYADDRLILNCVYCDAGNQATRDHVPSKVLLDKPYPTNLPVVPCCEECNHSFSKDEEYLACLIECVRTGTTDPDKLERETVRRILREQPKLRARIDNARREENGEIRFYPENDRVENVLLKLARGHSAFELSALVRRKPDHIAWMIVPTMAADQREQFDSFHVHQMFGEVGSRASQRMMVMEVSALSSAGQALAMGNIISDWVDVQDGRYRYLAVDDVGGVTIRFVISEYLACEVGWSWESES